jgi:hypothetical protein
MTHQRYSIFGYTSIFHGVSRGVGKPGNCHLTFFEKIKIEEEKEIYQAAHEPGYR